MKIIKLHVEEGRTLKSLSEEYQITKSSISILVKKFCKECQYNKKSEIEYDRNEFLQGHLAKLSWNHNQILLDKIKVWI